MRAPRKSSYSEYGQLHTDWRIYGQKSLLLLNYGMYLQESSIELDVDKYGNLGGVLDCWSK